MFAPPVPFLALKLEVPPSANRLWTVRRNKVVRSDHYRKWLAVASWTVLEQRRLATIDGPFAAVVRVPPVAGDLDNRIKATLDACQHGGAVKNDSFLRQLMVERHEGLEGYVVVHLWPVEAATFLPQSQR